jgi:hypothetical protein
MSEEFINTSGNGQAAVLPEELKGYNWGALLLSWIWGIGNKTYITLLSFLVAFIPFIGCLAALGMNIWFGFKGNEWAWQNKHFESIEHFKSNQKKWTIAGIIVTIVSIIVWIFFAMVIGAAAVSGALE